MIAVNKIDGKPSADYPKLKHSSDGHVYLCWRNGYRIQLYPELIIYDSDYRDSDSCLEDFTGEITLKNQIMLDNS